MLRGTVSARRKLHASFLPQIPSRRTKSRSMNQLVRQMKRWDLRVDTRATLPPSLSESRVHRSAISTSDLSDIQMVDANDRTQPLTRLSDINPRSNSRLPGPIVVGREQRTHIVASNNNQNLTLTDTASLSSSMISNARRQSKKLRDSSYDEISEQLSACLTISSHSSWNFEKVTGMQSTSKSQRRRAGVATYYH